MLCLALSLSALPAARARANVASGLGFAARHPLYFLRSRAVELVDLLSPLSFPVRSLRLADPGAPLASPWSRWLFAALAVLMVPLLLLAALRGATTMVASGAHRGLLLSVCAGVLASAPVNGLTRYRLPALPLLIAFAALAITGLQSFATSFVPFWRASLSCRCRCSPIASVSIF